MFGSILPSFYLTNKMTSNNACSLPLSWTLKHRPKTHLSPLLQQARYSYALACLFFQEFLLHFTFVNDSCLDGISSKPSIPAIWQGHFVSLNDLSLYFEVQTQIFHNIITKNIQILHGILSR